MVRYKNKTTALAGLMLAASAPALAETDFSPRVDLSAVWTDNYFLVGPGEQEEDELIGQVMPGFRLVHENPRLRAFMDYNLQALYSEHADGSEIFHQGNLGLVMQAVPDWLYVDVAATYQQNTVDPTQPQNIDNLFLIGNTADSVSGRLTPALRHTFRYARLDAVYSYGLVNYEGIDFVDRSVADSINHDAIFSLSSSDAEARLTWGTSYSRQKADYEGVQPFRHERAVSEIGVLVRPSLRLIARGGLESDPREDVSDAGLDETIWQAGFAWRSDEENELHFLVGERFFGTSYEVLWERTGSSVKWYASYKDEPTTESHDQVLRATPSAEEATPPPDLEFDRLGTDVYVLKRLGAGVTITGRLTSIGLNLNSERRDYLTVAEGEDDIRGGSVVVTRRLGPRTSLEGRAGIDEVELLEGIEYDETRYSVRLSRDVGRRSSTSVTLSRNERSQTAQSEYGVNWIVLGFQAAF